MSHQQNVEYSIQKDAVKLSDNPQTGNRRQGVLDFIRRQC